VVVTMREPLLVLEKDLRIRSANPAFLGLFQLTSEETVDRVLGGIAQGEWNHPRLTKALREVMEKGSRVDGLVLDQKFQKIGRKRLLLYARQIPAQDDRAPFVILSINDITESRQIELEILSISDREQRRMARELHDSLGQQLTAVGFLSQGLLNQIDSKTAPKFHEQANAVLAQANKAAAILHDLTHGLNPMRLEGDHFKTALQALASNVESLFKIACAFHITKPFRPPKSREDAAHLYRIVQESINNALRHGRATHISIEAHTDQDTGSMVVSIHDDGVGMKRIPGPGTIGRGMGLQIMRYRAEAAGGTLRIEHGTNGGTVVTAVIPQSQSTFTKA
jgi:two-component system, LuxR family, sensor kinase FixL